MSKKEVGSGMASERKNKGGNKKRAPRRSRRAREASRQNNAGMRGRQRKKCFIISLVWSNLGIQKSTYTRLYFYPVISLSHKALAVSTSIRSCTSPASYVSDVTFIMLSRYHFTNYLPNIVLREYNHVPFVSAAEIAFISFTLAWRREAQKSQVSARTRTDLRKGLTSRCTRHGGSCGVEKLDEVWRLNCKLGPIGIRKTTFDWQVKEKRYCRTQSFNFHSSGQQSIVKNYKTIAQAKQAWKREGRERAKF